MMTAWWSHEKIRATISQTYVEKELGSKKHQDTLHRVLAFGDGLTDDTYLDWILERSPRFFLILNDIGVPEKIFEVIDRSFDDDDLPLSQDALWELNLFGTPSETLDKKFYRHQFYFLVQELEPGGHVDYGPWDIVPLEPSLRKPSIASSLQFTDRVVAQDRLYTRKKIPTSSDKGIDRIRFLMHLKHIAAIQHRHLVTVWATYSQHEFNFVLLTPVTELTLRHVLDDKEQAKQFKSLDKHKRRQTLLTWIHCLTSGLAYLHSKGFPHKAIRPSTITIDHNNVIYLNEYNALKVLDVDESSNPYSGEMYDHAPPEDWLRKPCLQETAPLKTVLPGGGRTSRRIPKSPLSHSDSRHPSLTAGFDTMSRTASRSHSSSGSSSNPRPRNALITTFAPPVTTPTSLPDEYFPSDIFSLTTVLLTVLSFLLGHSPKAFASHRSRLNRQAGRGNAPPDASFHKNLEQVANWVDLLRKEAGQKEKKDKELWGAVAEIVKTCRDGIQKEPSARLTADELERNILGWVKYGIGRRRACSCSEGDREVSEAEEPNPILAAQRDSILSWSKLSERISIGPESEHIPPPAATRPRRIFSQRRSLERTLELRRSRQTRPDGSGINGRISSMGHAVEMPTSPVLRRHTSTARKLVQMEHAPQHISKQSKGDGPTVVHQGRSSYRIRPPNRQCPRTQQRSIREDDIYPEGPIHGDLSRKHGKSMEPYPVIDGISIAEDNKDEGRDKDLSGGIDAEIISCTSYANQSEVWGLGNALDEDEGSGDEEDEEVGKFEDMDWPLPLGTLTFEQEANS
ncbi:MAG: hypothetical protein Q9163_003436 [Psora crenata]